MTARVLVVDDILANVKLFEARLTAEYFEVLTAYNGQQALEICERDKADVVLLDVMMPEMDGYEVCRRLKDNPKTHHIPVIMVTALDQPSEKVKGLEAGADDFLTKPVDDIALITRVRNLARLKTLTDEMLMRATTSEQMGLSKDTEREDLGGHGGKILLVEDRERSAERIYETLDAYHSVQVETDISVALSLVLEGFYDLIIVSLNLRDSDGLRLCSQIRTQERTRHLPIVTIVEPGESARLMRGLDMGVNDYLMRPIEKNELLARIKTQVRRKKYADHLRSLLDQSVEMAITDSLTKLYNRRYMEMHMSTLVEEAILRGRPLSVLVADIDYFKSINDTYGHDAGDMVLKQFAARFSKNTRGIDLTCRFGGEEFVVIMPETDLAKAYMVGERLRRAIAERPFKLNDEQSIELTASIGISTLEHLDDSSERLIKRADKALYSAKKDGRNRVVADAA